MKTTFNYGAGIAVASFLFGLILFFAGYHNDPDKLSTGQLIGSVGSVVILIIGLVMAIKARRAEMPAEEDFGYGRALGAGALTALWAAVLGAVLTFVYASMINPGMQEVIVESEVAKLEEQGLSSEQIEQAEGFIELMTGPVAMSLTNLIFGFVMSFVIALIVAIFLRRQAVEVSVPPPPSADEV
jgi:multisubunit Na+/H+ antiporter MnhB subunit